MAKSKKVVRSAPKRALRTAGALSHPKTPKPETCVLQPENFGYPIELRRNARIGFTVITGCRRFTPAQAATHWQARLSGNCSTRLCEICSRARKMLKLLPLLAQRAARYGWKPSKR